jgi:hypothetical protein
MVEAARYPVICSHTGFRELDFTADVPFSSINYRNYGTSDVHKVAHEGDKTAAQIERIRALGGVIAPILNQGDSRSWRSRIANDSPGSSKSWAQAYLYAVEKMGGRGVGLGSDVNGLAELPGPRFGTYASHSLENDSEREHLRLTQANLQRNGVRYSSHIDDYRHYRFEGGVYDTGVYGPEGSQIWEAIAIYKSRTNPERADISILAPGPSSKIRNLAKGFWAGETGAALEGRPDVITGTTYAEQRTGFLVRRNLRPTDADPAGTQRLYPHVKRIWDQWTAMEGVAGTPLTRSTAGRRDFDINLDGMAHYGLLPDFIQDLRNVGLTEADLNPLFNSAEHYIQMWELCRRRPAL